MSSAPPLDSTPERRGTASPSQARGSSLPAARLLAWKCRSSCTAAEGHCCSRALSLKGTVAGGTAAGDTAAGKTAAGNTAAGRTAAGSTAAGSGSVARIPPANITATWSKPEGRLRGRKRPPSEGAVAQTPCRAEGTAAGKTLPRERRCRGEGAAARKRLPSPPHPIETASGRSRTRGVRRAEHACAGGLPARDAPKHERHPGAGSIRERETPPRSRAQRRRPPPPRDLRHLASRQAGQAGIPPGGAGRNPARQGRQESRHRLASRQRVTGAP